METAFGGGMRLAQAALAVNFIRASWSRGSPKLDEKRS